MIATGQQKVWIVTGSSSGLGRSFVKRLWKMEIM